MNVANPYTPPATECVDPPAGRRRWPVLRWLGFALCLIIGTFYLSVGCVSLSGFAEPIRRHGWGLVLAFPPFYGLIVILVGSAALAASGFGWLRWRRWWPALLASSAAAALMKAGYYFFIPPR
jgi:hypothetical protein